LWRSAKELELKSLIITVGAAVALVAVVTSYSPAEPVVPVGQFKQAAIATKRIVVNAGYRCDRITFFARSSITGTLHLSCNENQYSYDVYDAGGSYVVEVVR
jgi:hypothetical protein